MKSIDIDITFGQLSGIARSLITHDESYTYWQRYCDSFVDYDDWNIDEAYMVIGKAVVNDFYIEAVKMASQLAIEMTS